MINIKHIIRKLLRNKYYTLINISGLGLGLGCVMLMAIYLIHEFSFDRFYPKADNLYRIVDGKNCKLPFAAGEAFKKVPEIENIFRIYALDQTQVVVKDEIFDESTFVMADSSILQMLDMKILTGKKSELMAVANCLILSEKMADKYFPGENPVGKTLKIRMFYEDVVFQITGVYKNFPSNSSLQADFISDIKTSFKLLFDIEYSLGVNPEREKIDFYNAWTRNEFMSFVQLRPNSNKLSVELKCSKICLKHRSENVDGGIHLQPFTDMYLHSEDIENTYPLKINQLQSLKIFMGIGLLILLVAAINFILMSNVDNKQSAIEIACRKVNGASRIHILFNALFRSCFVAFLSLIPAIFFVHLTLPLFNKVFQNQLNISLLLQPSYILAIFAITLVSSIASGIYLGIYVSGLSPVKLFHNDTHNGNKGKFRGSLVIFQFITFIILVTSLVFMERQYRFSLKKDIGINTSNVLVVDFGNELFRRNCEFIKNKMLGNPNVRACIPTSFMTPPTDNRINVNFRDAETNQERKLEALVMGVGELELLGIPVLRGNTLTRENAQDIKNMLINETAAKKFEKDAGDNISDYKIIGVVPDFNFHSLHEKVGPILIFPQTSNYPNLLIKTKGDNAGAIKYLKEICNSIAPGFTFDYETLEERVAGFYENEEKQVRTLAFFSAVAMLLSTMGLLGFVSINLTIRTKEIGIRKINGARFVDILQMFYEQYMKWVLVAFIIACPVAWYALRKWLENFSYKVDLSWWLFGLIGGLTLFIALGLITIQSYKAANKNPVDSLRYE